MKKILIGLLALGSISAFAAGNIQASKLHGHLDISQSGLNPNDILLDVRFYNRSGHSYDPDPLNSMSASSLLNQQIVSLNDDGSFVLNDLSLRNKKELLVFMKLKSKNNNQELGFSFLSLLDRNLGRKEFFSSLNLLDITPPITTLNLPQGQTVKSYIDQLVNLMNMIPSTINPERHPRLENHEWSIVMTNRVLVGFRDKYIEFPLKYDTLSNEGCAFIVFESCLTNFQREEVFSQKSLKAINSTKSFLIHSKKEKVYRDGYTVSLRLDMRNPTSGNRSKYLNLGWEVFRTPKAVSMVNCSINHSPDIKKYEDYIKFSPENTSLWNLAYMRFDFRKDPKLKEELENFIRTQGDTPELTGGGFEISANFNPRFDAKCSTN